jgi:hypothetical protein
MSFENLIHRLTRTDLLENQINRYPCPNKNGFTHHDFGVNLDVFLPLESHNAKDDTAISVTHSGYSFCAKIDFNASPE